MTAYEHAPNLAHLDDAGHITSLTPAEETGEETA